MGNRISIPTLATRLSASTGKGRKSCEEFIREFFKLASESLTEGENIRIKGFGTFKISIVEPRGSVDVSSGLPTEISSHKKVVFTPSKEMSGFINAPFEIFESVELEDVPLKTGEETSSVEENKIENGILKAGSEEEGLDDVITYEAYEEEQESAINNDEVSETVNTAASQNADTIQESRPNEIGEEDSVQDLPQGTIVPEVVYVEGKSNYGKGFVAGALSVLVVCLVILGLGCFLGWWAPHSDNAKDINDNLAVVSLPAGSDTPIEEPDSLVSENPTVEEQEVIYDTVSTTRYLTTIAREHYGNFNFWPYIYIENEKILGHPDRITPGTKVVVPSLKKYGVDPANKEDEKTAKAKGLEIYARFKKR